MRKSRPDSGLGTQIKVFEIYQVVPSSPESGQGLGVRVEDVPSAKFGPDVRSAWCRVQGSESRAQCPGLWVDGVGLKGCLVSLAAARPERRVLEERERTHD